MNVPPYYFNYKAIHSCSKVVASMILEFIQKQRTINCLADAFAIKDAS